MSDGLNSRAWDRVWGRVEDLVEDRVENGMLHCVWDLADCRAGVRVEDDVEDREFGDRAFEEMNR